MRCRRCPACCGMNTRPPSVATHPRAVPTFLSASSVTRHSAMESLTARLESDIMATLAGTETTSWCD
jgi:hypothetical protein